MATRLGDLTFKVYIITLAYPLVLGVSRPSRSQHWYRNVRFSLVEHEAQPSCLFNSSVLYLTQRAPDQQTERLSVSTGARSYGGT